MPRTPVPVPFPRRADEPVDRREAAAYWTFWGHLAALFGIALSNGLLAVSVLVAPWKRLRSRLARPEVQPILIGLGLYVGLLVLSVAGSVDPGESVRELGEVFNLLTLLMALVLVRDERTARLAVDAVVVIATFEAVVGLGQYLAQGGFDLGQRLQGSMSHYMTFSGVLLIADLFLLAQVAIDIHRPSWRWLALVPINLALAGSLTRSAWVGVIAGFLVVVAVGRRRLLLAGIPLMLLLVLWLPEGTVLRRAASILDLTDATNYDRVCMAYAGLQMIEERPVLGQGPLMVRQRYPIYRHPTAPRLWVPHLHNSFLQIAAERGLPALAAYLFLMGVAFRRAWRLYRGEGGRSGPRADLMLGVLAAIVGFNVSGLFESNWSDTELQRILLLVLALPFALPASAPGPAPAAAASDPAPRAVPRAGAGS